MTDKTNKLPIIALRGTVAFEDLPLTFDAGRDISISAVEQVIEGDKLVFAVPQVYEAEHPSQTDLCEIGVIFEIKHIMRLPDGALRVYGEGKRRAQLRNLIDCGFCLYGEVELIEGADIPVSPADKEISAQMRLIKRKAVAYAQHHGKSSDEIAGRIRGERRPGHLCDFIALNIIEDLDSRIMVLMTSDIMARLGVILVLIERENEIDKLENSIAYKVHEAMDKQNREYYLREQINVIQHELGDDADEDIAELRKKLKASKISGEAREKTEREMRRLTQMTMHSPESGVSYNYIEYMLSIPWEVYTETKIDIANARKILERDHYGMREVKDRLLEYLGVRALNPELRSPIICLVGPPGVGKTSIAHSLAEAMGRKFAQMSLGGVHDEAELRGHRRTYIGSMPGRIIAGLEQCKSMDPLFLLDEVDKLARDMRGDPASALLEILDPEQNNHFRDHYIDAPVDLSRVMFITTANTTATIDSALLDRMEVIELTSYTADEKLQIAKRHLVPKQLKQHGLKASIVRVKDEALEEIIEHYTRESGVRNLERLIAQVCRKAALRLSEDGIKSITVNPSVVHTFLGVPKYIRTPAAQKDNVGVVNGLAWTSVGGEVMPVEALILDGSGNVELTGKLGDVMKESAKLAQTTVRSYLDSVGLPIDYFKKHDMHVHVPEGAVPKDGPSAGVALTCAMLSAVTGIPARGDIAMTGEITLTGKVLPIGGVKEKLLAAYRMGIHDILLPSENEKDLEDIDNSVRGSMHIDLIENVDQAFVKVLTKPIKKRGGAHA